MGAINVLPFVAAKLLVVIGILNVTPTTHATVFQHQETTPDVIESHVIAKTYQQPATSYTVSVSQMQVRTLIIDAAAKYGVSGDTLLRVARCESNFNRNAVNYNYTAGGGHPSGVFQFLPSTWVRMSQQASYGGYSVFDAVANVNVAAWAFANGYSGEWSCK